MADNRNNCHGSGSFIGNRESVCVDVNRILDSCRDKDCFENVKVFLNEYGREIIENAGSVRAKCSKILAANISVEPVQFNRGFYQIYIRFYVKIVFEACVGMGRGREFDGIAVCEKNVILYGSEGNVNIFKSEIGSPCSQSCNNSTLTNNLPTVVVEAVDPVILGSKIMDSPKMNCCCCCSADEIPESLCDILGGNLDDRDDCKNLYVSLGFFSVIRIERPGQYIISANEFSVPDKQCVMSEPDDPCRAFAKMDFPVNEFSPPSLKEMTGEKSCCN